MAEPDADFFTGGSPALFERAGREQLVALLEHGLTARSTVADIGCGALRGGRWIIPVLDPERYCGIEPNRQMLETGLRRFIDPALVEIKRPRFAFNDQFDLSEFDTRFSHVMLRSIWTHASKPQIELSLDNIARFGDEDVVALASVIMQVPRKDRPWRFRRDYRQPAWVGRSHESDQPGMVWHSRRWLRAACADRGLVVKRWRRKPVGGQVWLRVTRA